MRVEQLVNFQNIAPGQTAILTCPLGPTYERLKINLLNGLTLQQIGWITGKINDKPFFTVWAADLLTENLYEGRSNPNGLILLDFTRKNAISSSSSNGPTSQVAEQLATALCSALMQKLTFEFQLNPVGSANPAPAGCNMQAFAQLNNPSKNPLALKQLYTSIAMPFAQDNDIPLAVGRAGAIIKKLYLHQTNTGPAWAVSTAYAIGAMVVANGNVYQATVAGTSAATGTGPSGNGNAIADGTVTWAFVSTAGSIQKIQLRNAGVIILERFPADLGSDQADYGKVSQTGLTVVDFDLQGMRDKWLNTTVTGNVFLRVTTQSGAYNARMYQSIVDPISRA